jgi:hypothetical protein
VLVIEKGSASVTRTNDSVTVTFTEDHKVIPTVTATVAGTTGASEATDLGLSVYVSAISSSAVTFSISDVNMETDPVPVHYTAISER